VVVLLEKNKKFWGMKKIDDKTGELTLYGEISDYTWWGDEVTPKQFKEDLDALGDIDILNVYINSPGGDVFAGQAIYSMLKRHKAYVNVFIDGIAASIASLIAMAGDKVIMPENAMMMIHSPWTFAVGNAQDFRKLADDMDKIRDSMIVAYESRSALTTEEITEIMDAETWLSAEECLEYGFADEIAEAKQIAASMDEKYFAVYRNIPDELKRPPDKEVNSSDKDLIKQKLLLELEL
jgi:ATP-dependent Clp protease protease subunit